VLEQQPSAKIEGAREAPRRLQRPNRKPPERAKSGDAGQVREALRQAGLRVTTARLAVYRTLAEMGGHHGADEVVAAMRSEGRPVARASVYASLDALSRAGVVMPAATGPGCARYEVADSHHHHFVCRSCGTVADVGSEAEDDLAREVPPALGSVESAEVIFWGICPACSGSPSGDGRR
jgi:Fur family transcriptional regulator, stress-responsive regulator